MEEKPTIDHIYEDGVCTECGNLKRCDGLHKQGHCEVCKNCNHDFIYGPNLFADTNSHYSIAECSYCSEAWFILHTYHTYYYKNAVDVISNCEERWTNTICTYCNHTRLKQTYIKHPYDENGVCTECGDITHFIESEEYFDGYTWWSIDRTYGLNLSHTSGGYMIYSYVGTPVDIIIPAGINGISIVSIGGYYGFGGYIEPFKNCESLETLIFPDDAKMYGAKNCPNLKLLYKKSEVPEEYMYMININYKENE
ncbi:MAG: hypothetical protein E7370_02690 [Clostridiales bacterium]|nr:hypothetical protein [Clostridiales bacterium]